MLVFAWLSPAQAGAQAAGPKEASRRILSVVPVAIAAIMTSGPETTSYGYDAKGRPTKVVQDGALGAPVITSYDFDRADNRTKLMTAGSRNPPQP